MKRVLWPWLGVATAIAGALVCLTNNPARLIFGLRTGYLDMLQRQRPTHALDGPGDHIVMVGIDAETRLRLGKTLPREELAIAFRNLAAAGPKAILVDMVFADQDPSARLADRALERVAPLIPKEKVSALEEVRRGLDPDAQLAEAFGTGLFVGGFYSSQTLRESIAVTDMSEFALSGLVETTKACDFAGYTRVLLNTPVLQEAMALHANVLVNPDLDQVARRYPLFTRVGPAVRPSMALLAAAIHLDSSTKLRAECARDGSVASFHMGEREIPVDREGNVLIDYTGTFERSFPKWVPLWEIREGKFDPSRFKDKLVFVGARDDLEDFTKTPRGAIFSGFGIHATVASALIEGRNLRRAAAAWEVVAALLFGLSATLALVLSGNPRVPVIAGAGLPIAGHFLSVWLARNGWLVDLVTPTLTGSVAVLLCGTARYMRERMAYLAERSQREALERELKSFLSPAVAEIVMRDPERKALLPAKREVSILFSDIRGFTTISEGMPPDALVGLLREYLTAMTGRVFANGGTLDKYIGDGVMALFGAPLESPDHPVLACRTALQMCTTLDALRDGWRKRGLPELEIGIGVNTGVVSVGRMGSDTKHEYTCIGDEVNFASRVEGLTKEYGARAIVGERTRVLAGDAMVFRELGLVKVKGKNRSARIFEVLGESAQFPRTPAWVESFQRGLAAFQTKSWDVAEQEFRATIAARGLDPPSQMYLGWIAELRTHAPKDAWDGTLERKTK